MADEQTKDQKTEDATPQRIQKAREEGQLGFSSELIGGVMLSTAVALAWFSGDAFFNAIGSSIAARLGDFEDVIVDPRQLVKVLIADTRTIGIATLAFVMPIAVLAVMGGVLQTGFNISSKPLNLDPNKLSVKSGFSRIFSTKSLVRGGLSIIKATMVLTVFYLVARSKLEAIVTAGAGGFKPLMGVLCEVLLYASTAVAGMLLVVGIVDFAYQKWKHLDDLKMTVQEIKDEHKDTDGDPMIKARIKRLQAEMGRKRMLADVPKASVVITNPTHFAVAVRYDSDSMDAPIVIAKGADFLAKKIIAIAKENGVAVVERKPVARFLYANVEIGNMVPFELYQAIAEILNFVNKMRRAA